jgi:steroid delta-isomerase-like uncharacterized protein
MSAEENKAIARRHIDRLDQRDLAGAAELVATNYIGHFALHPEPLRGIEAFKQYMSGFFTAFPDLRFNIEDILAEGDKAVARWTAHGTHNGELLGIPPTARQVTVTGMWILRIAGDKIAEQWGVSDALGMLQQLGIIPASGKGGE